MKICLVIEKLWENFKNINKEKDKIGIKNLYYKRWCDIFCHLNADVDTKFRHISIRYASSAHYFSQVGISISELMVGIKLVASWK